jgi:hypothetical protein
MMCLWASFKKKYGKQNFLCILKINEGRSRIRSWIRIHFSQRYGSGDPDPDPHQNVTDPTLLYMTRYPPEPSILYRAPSPVPRHA